MNQRDGVAQLAKTDFAAAFKRAGSTKNVRERIQSLGWIARYAPADKIPRVIAAVNKCAGTSSDFYEDVMALAWPLRALHETGNAKLMASLLKTATNMAADVSPAASRAEAIGLLIHAVLPAGLKLATSPISSLINLRGESHWRVIRTFVDVSLLVNAHDRQRALEIANSIAVANKRKSTVERVVNDEQMEPRPFFW